MLFVVIGGGGWDEGGFGVGLVCDLVAGGLWIARVWGREGGLGMLGVGKGRWWGV